MNGEELLVVFEVESLFFSIFMFDKIIIGFNIVGIVFGLVGFVIIIGLGVWILDNLDKVINDVDKK